MPNQYDEYDDDDSFEESGPANLRKALKKADKQRKELEEQLAALQSSMRERSVKDVLEAKGVNSKIAAFIPKDITAPEAIASWLDEYADVFGFANQQQSAEPEISEDARTAMRMDGTVASASNPGRDEDLMSRVKSATTREELDNLIFGGSTGR